MISGRQIRAARALLRWTLPHLSVRTKVPEHLLFDAEQTGDLRFLTLDQIEVVQAEMERAGVEFMNFAQPDVRMWKANQA